MDALNRFVHPTFTNGKQFGHLATLRYPIGLIPYNGTFLIPWTNLSRNEQMKNTFELAQNDVLLASYPKCGHHWLTRICLEIIRKNNDKNVNKTKDIPHYYKTADIGLNSTPHLDFYPSQIDEKEFNERVKLTEHIYPRLWMSHSSYTHLPIKSFHPKSKIITLIRNPKDTVVSGSRYFQQIMEQFGEDIDKHSVSDYLSYFLRGIVIWGDYFTYYQEFWKVYKENKHNILFLYYEDMVDDPLNNIRKISQFIYDGDDDNELFLSDNDYTNIVNETSFDNMKKEAIQNPQTLEFQGNILFRKGISYDWEHHLTEKEVELIDETMYFKWAQYCSDIKYYQDLMKTFNPKYNKGYFDHISEIRP